MRIFVGIGRSVMTSVNLQTSVGEVLAERCVKQPSELKSGK